MRLTIIPLFILAMLELPVLRAKKLVVVMPRQVRQSPGAPWRHPMMLLHAKKLRYYEQGFSKPKYSPGGQFYRHQKDVRFSKQAYPQGGDDFDQGHEEVNHVIVPHGKGITHAVSFGKGYIPFESASDDRRAKFYPRDSRYAASTSLVDPGPNYFQAQISQQADRGSIKDDAGGEPRDRIEDRGVPGSPGIVGASYGLIPGHRGLAGKSGLYLPSIFNRGNVAAASKRGIVLRDSVLLDDYRRKIAQLTKNWPSSFSANDALPLVVSAPARRASPPSPGASGQFDGNNGLVDSGQIGNERGYAVKEDVVDAPRDFRTMPIDTAPHQGQPPVFQQPRIIHQQPVQQTLRQIYPSQTSLPADYPPMNYRGYVEG